MIEIRFFFNNGTKEKKYEFAITTLSAVLARHNLCHIAGSQNTNKVGKVKKKSSESGSCKI